MIGFGQCVSGNCKNGYGVFTSEEGTYKGYWKNGKVHGNGLFKGSSLDYDYDGEYLNGKKHGQGKMTYTNGKIEEGLFENNKFVKARSGCVSGDCKNGYGKYEWPAGDKYSGNYKNGYRNGYGTYTWANGDKYTGNLKNNEKHGQGTYTWVSGDKWKGKWENDERNGYGTLTWADGYVTTGIWINSVYQEEEETTTTFKPTVTPSNSYNSSNSSSNTYSSYTYSILSYDFNNNIPFNIRYSYAADDIALGMYIGCGFNFGKLPTSSGIYEVENGQPIMYDGDATIGSFGPKIEESRSIYSVDIGITKHLFWAIWWSAGLGWERNLVVEKREHFYSHDGSYWGIEWLENKDESSHIIFVETDVYVKIYDVIAVKYGISYKNNAINSVVGVGFAF